MTARPPAHEGFGHAALEIVVSNRARLRSRTARSRGITVTWYAADRSNRPPLWREVAHDVVRRAMASSTECRRLIAILLAVGVLVVAAAVVIGLVVPPAVFAGGVALTASGGWWAHRRRAS